MRLIDADPLIRNIEAMAAEYDAISIHGIIEALKEATAINPDDLRTQGRWIWNEENECWLCSNCESSALNNYRGNSADSDYCPNCGACMRGDASDKK